MTQALINKLNIVSDKNINLTNKVSKNQGMDFGKVFETKTGEITKKSADNNPKTFDNDKKTNELKPQTDKTETNKDTVSDNTNKTNTTENATDTTQKAEKEDKNIKQPIKGVVRKSDKDDENSTDEDTTITNDDDSISVITDEESDYTDETIITDEEPTMYNELITLENPTAMLLLQSQIQQVLTTNTQNEQTEIADNNSATSGLTTQNNLTGNSTNNNSDVFKQLDTYFTKNTEIVKNSVAEITRSKTDTHKSSNILNENIVKELNVEILSSESAELESSMGDLMQNQSPQEQTARIMIQGDIKYESVATESAKNITQPKTTTVQVTPGRIIEQVSKQIEGMYNNSKLNMILNPESLGKLNLQIINSKDGIMAQFTVQTQEARDILMKGLNGLKETLLAQGVNVDNISVKLENTENEYESDYTEQEGSGGGNKQQGAKKQKENGKDFEEMMFNLENENNV